MRLQIAFPDTFAFIDPTNYLQFVTMHGMIMVIYLLTALFLGGFGNYMIPLMLGAGHGVSVCKYGEFLGLLCGRLDFGRELLRSWRSVWSGWTLYPPQAIMPGTPGTDGGIILMLLSLALFIVGFTMGGLNYVTTVLQQRTRGMSLMRMPLTIWAIFIATILALLAFPALLVAQS